VSNGDDTPPPHGDAYAPPRIARLVQDSGVAKAAMPALQTLVLAFLGGAFIALGAMYFTAVIADSALGAGPTRLLGGVAFSLGLILVVVGGAELFTGNNLIVMAWVDGRIPLGRLLRNWGLVYAGNLVGALGTVALMHLSGALAPGGPAARAAAAIAAGKVALPWGEAFFRGVLCNVLVCLAVWLAMGARTTAGRIPAIVFPVSAFVALGFEHSVANMYLIPMGWLAGADGVTLAGLVGNLVPVTLGNVVGGGVFVALVYWLVYLRGSGPGATP